MVAVISNTGIRLMPTSNYRARKLLKSGRAEIYKYRPVFTIRLLNRETGDTQPVEYKSDTGYQHVGISICSEKHETVHEQRDMLEGEVENHALCRKLRKGRRNRKRYRKPRFANRKGMIVRDGFAPSLRNRRDTQAELFRQYNEVIPITSAHFEMGMFDTQVLKALAEGKPLPERTDYQHGEQYGFATLREAVFARDNYTCIICKRSAFNDGAKLHLHHLGYWKEKPDRSNRMSNLGTACELCHTSANHQPDGKLFGLKPDLAEFKGATFMTVIRFNMLGMLKAVAPDVDVHMCYGAATKLARRSMHIEKTHANDAYCIGKFHPKHRCQERHFQKLRRNDRVIEKFHDAKYIDMRDGIEKKASALGCNRIKRWMSRNNPGNFRPFRGRKTANGSRAIRKQRYSIRPGDMVIYDGSKYTVHGTQNNGKTLSLDTTKTVKVSDLLLPKAKDGSVRPLKVGQKLALVGKKEKHTVLSINGDDVVMRWYFGVKPDAVKLADISCSSWKQIN